MSDTPRSTPKAEAFAARAAARLELGPDVSAPVARFDPIWIALTLAILKLLIEYLGPRLDPNFPLRIARLKAPRWWQPRALLLRARLAAAVRRQIVQLRERLARGPDASPAVDDSLVDPSLDAVLDEAAASSPELLQDLARENQS